MREMLGAFNGNEMVLGILLANWLWLTGLGAWLGRGADRFRRPLLLFVLGQIVISLAPPAQVLALRAGLHLVFPRGAEIGLGGTLLTSFVLLLPLCLASGFLLTLAGAVLAKAGGAAAPAAAIGRVYLADALGSILGGLLFTFVLLRFFDHFSLVCLPALLNLALAAWAARRLGKKWLATLALALAGAVLGLLGWGKLDARSTAAQFGPVLFCANSPYGKLVVSQTAGQLNFYQNGVPVASTDDLADAEETAHYALAQRPRAARVLLLSGSLSGAAREVLKHGVREVVCVELDPLVLQAGRRFRPEVWSDPRLTPVNTDGRLFVKQSTRPFDLAILDLPDPANSQLNRFFTAEFFREVKRTLAPDGVLAFPLAGYENYVSPELARLFACANRTLGRGFRHVLLLPGGRTFFLASDGPLSADIAGALEQQRVPTRLVNRHYLQAMLTPDRLDQVREAAGGAAEVNEDFNPVLYYYHLLYWSSQFQGRFGPLAAAAALVVVLALLRFRPVPLAMFAAGFASTSLQIVLLLAYQILYGSLYRQLGLLITLFMAGLAAGAFLIQRLGTIGSCSGTRESAAEMRLSHESRYRFMDRKGVLAILSLLLAAFAALLPALLRAFSALGALPWVQMSIYFLTFVLAALVGAMFPLAARAEGKTAATAAATLYAADFLGASLGALLVSALLIPLLGVMAVCWITAALNLLAATLQAPRALGYKKA
jgi:spermidine synthase